MNHMRILSHIAITAALLFPGMAWSQSSTELLSRARRGDPGAMRILGKRLYDGYSLRRDVASAVGWWEKAANRGDTQSMVYLGDMYMHGVYYGQNTEKAIAWWERAADKGNKAAKKRLKKHAPHAVTDRQEEAPDTQEATESAATHLVAPTPGPAPEPAPRYPDCSQIINDMVSHISTKAHQAGVSSISLLTFLHNGSKSNELTAHVRNLLIEQLSEKNPHNISYFDREDSKLVAEESGLALDGEQLSSSEAILMGEIFSSPGDKVGYISYRLFRAADTRVVAAGYSGVQWTRDEQQLHQGHSRKLAANSLPQIDKKELETLAAKIKRVQTGIAIVQESRLSADNTRDARMAFAQIFPLLLHKGNILFEREYFRLAARETALNGNEVMPGQGIGAVGRLSATTGSTTCNKYKLQISAIPKGNLLVAHTFSQKKGSVPNSSGAGVSENDFNSFMDDLDARNRDVQLVYEGERIIEDEHKTRMEERIHQLYKEHNGDRKAILRELQKELIIDTINNCLKNDADKQIEFTGIFGQCPSNCFSRQNFAEQWVKHPTHGTFTIRNGFGETPSIKMEYTIGITYDDRGLPHVIRYKIDFTPSKKYIIKKQN